jgi:hypothetical protein
MNKPREPGRPRGVPYPVVKSIRFSERDGERIGRLAEKLELPVADVLRLALRELAKREGVE